MSRHSEALHAGDVADFQPVHVRLRAMRGRGVLTAPNRIREGNVVRVDGMRYRVQADPHVHLSTGSVVVPVYSEDNQTDTLYLSANRPVPVIGDLP